MPDISSYKINTAPDPSDILIGTDVSNGQTKNFSVQSLSVAALNNFLKHTSWQFITLDPDPDPRPEGTISFENYGGQSTQWSDITGLYINVTMPSTSPVALPYLQRLIGYDIVIQDVRSLGRYGVYKLNSLNLIGGSVYEMDLTYITGSSTIQALQYYSIQIDLPSIESDKHFVFEQGVSNDTWDIQHNLNKFPSVSIVDTQNTSILGGQVNYINANELTITFLTSFAGKAYLN